jgi:hypothetical protein
MYLWNLVGNNASQDRMRSGAGDDLALIMRAIEGDLLDGSAFVARIHEVVFRVSVADLGEVHVPTGREWHGRRDGHGGVHWEQRIRSADPGSTPRSLTPDCDLDALAS